MLGDTRELSKVFFETATVKEISEQDNEVFETLVDNIQQMKKNGENTFVLENEIEQRLAQIYALTDDDILLIASSENRTAPVVPSISERSSAVSM